MTGKLLKSLISLFILTCAFIAGCECNSPTQITYTPDIETYSIDIYDAARAFNGTTLFTDNHDPAQKRAVEVDMNGEIIWSWDVTPQLMEFTNPGFEAERLENGNTFLVFPGWGILEMNEDANVIWHHEETDISHDADRIANRRTLFVFGNRDSLQDWQVKEIDYAGTQTWGWRAGAHFFDEFQDVEAQGWTHINAVSQLANGNILVSLRNFHLLAEIARDGTVVNEFGRDLLKFPHDPEKLPDGNILLANQTEIGSGDPHAALEFDPVSNTKIWEFPIPDSTRWPVRDADRLPNGNTLITTATALIEVTGGGEIVWQLTFKDAVIEAGQGASRGFYKAQRIAE